MNVTVSHVIFHKKISVVGFYKLQATSFNINLASLKIALEFVRQKKIDRKKKERKGLENKVCRRRRLHTKTKNKDSQKPSPEQGNPEAQPRGAPEVQPPETGRESDQ